MFPLLPMVIMAPLDRHPLEPFPLSQDLLLSINLRCSPTQVKTHCYIIVYNQIWCYKTYVATLKLLLMQI
jgi:hypothetical protein